MKTFLITLLFAVCLSGVLGFAWDNNCIGNTFPENITQYCAENPSAKVPYRPDCSAYYDCSFAFDDPDHIPRYYEQHLRVCNYAQLFDPVSENCMDFSDVTCCDRIEPIAPCDYRQFKCQYPHCIPCDFNRPSCAGRGDGLYEVENRPQLFFQCQQQRTVSASIQSCPVNQQFDSRGQQCAPVINS